MATALDRMLTQVQGSKAATASGGKLPTGGSNNLTTLLTKVKASQYQSPNSAYSTQPVTTSAPAPVSGNKITEFVSSAKKLAQNAIPQLRPENKVVAPQTAATPTPTKPQDAAKLLTSPVVKPSIKSDLFDFSTSDPAGSAQLTPRAKIDLNNNIQAFLTTPTGKKVLKAGNLIDIYYDQTSEALSKEGARAQKDINKLANTGIIQPAYAPADYETDTASLTEPEINKLVSDWENQNDPTKSLAAKLNRATGLFVVGTAEGATGGIVKAEKVEPKDLSGKIAYGLGQVLGASYTLKKIGTVFDSFASGSTTVASFLSKYPKAGKPVLALAKNVLGFDLYGQLDPDTQNRFQKLALDTAMGTLFTGVGGIKKGVISVPTNFAVGFGLAKWAGASNEDAFVAGGIMAVLDASQRGNKYLFETSIKGKAGSVRFTPDEAMQQVRNTNLKGTPAGDALEQAALQAKVQNKDLQVQIIAGKVSNRAQDLLKLETPKGIQFTVDLIDPVANTPKLTGKQQPPAAKPSEPGNVPMSLTVTPTAESSGFAATVAGAKPKIQPGETIGQFQQRTQAAAGKPLLAQYDAAINAGKPFEAQQIAAQIVADPSYKNYKSVFQPRTAEGVLATLDKAQQAGDYQTATAITDQIRNMNKPLNVENAAKLSSETVAGNREQFRLNTPVNITKTGSALGAKVTPDTVVTVYRGGTGPVAEGDFVTTNLALANKYVSEREDAKIFSKDVPAKDLVMSGGLKQEFIYAPEVTTGTADISKSISTIGDSTTVFRGSQTGKIDTTRDNGITGGVSMSTSEDVATQFAKKVNGKVTMYTIPADARIINHSELEKIPRSEVKQFLKDNEIDVVRFDIPGGAQGEEELRIINDKILIPMTSETRPALEQQAKKATSAEALLSSLTPAYHGTTKQFEQFDAAQLGTSTGAASAKEGFFFTPQQSVAQTYASKFKTEAERIDNSIKTLDKQIEDLTGDKYFTASHKMLQQNMYDRPSGYTTEQIEKLEPLLEKRGEVEGEWAVLEDPYFQPDGLNEIAPGASIKEVYLDMQRPLIVDQKGKQRDVGGNEKFITIVNRAKATGHDSVIIKNTYDYGHETSEERPPHDVFVVFKTDQIKSKEDVIQMYEKTHTPESSKLGKYFTTQDQEKLQEAHDQVMAELEIAEPGQRLFDENGSVSGSVSSTFPSWVPDDLRSSALFDSVLSGISDLNTIQYPPDSQPRKQALYDVILSEIDDRAGTNSIEIVHPVKETNAEKETKQENAPVVASSAQGSEAAAVDQKVEVPKMYQPDSPFYVDTSAVTLDEYLNKKLTGIGEQRKLNRSLLTSYYNDQVRRQAKTSSSPLANLAADINAETARRSHMGISFSPEKRGEQEIVDYVATMTDAYEKLQKLATDPEKQATLDRMFASFRAGYKTRANSYLETHGRMLSPMITGPANFPNSRNSKVINTLKNKSQEKEDFYNKMMKRISNELNPQTFTGTSTKTIGLMDEKLANLKKQQQQMKDANKIIKSKTDVLPRLKALGLSDQEIKDITGSGTFGLVGYAGYQLTSVNNKIKTLEKRLQVTTAKREAADTTGNAVFKVGDATVTKNYDQDRLQITFDGIPPVEVRDKLKSAGFRWSPFNKAWQRVLTNEAIRSAKRVLAPDQGTGSSAGTEASTAKFTEALPRGTVTPDAVKIIEFPEMVALVKRLLGEVPKIKKIRANGYFKYNPLYQSIVLNRDLFTSEKQAARTLAHEIGHLTDFMGKTGNTIKRGNLLGRLATLVGYHKQFIADTPPEWTNVITQKDKDALMKRAREMAQEPTEVTKQVTIGEQQVEPSEILAIWNDSKAGRNNPDLLSYIQTLSSADKVEIVKAALKGVLPKWMKFTNKVTQTITVKELQKAPEDIKKLYKKLLEEEIIKRRLVNVQVVREELKKLSYAWRPFYPGLATKQELAYRNSGKELYADAISVLFNDPVRLMQDAPVFYRTFFNYLENKPKASEAFYDAWALLNKGEDEVLAERIKSIKEMGGEAEQTHKALELEKEQKRRDFMFLFKRDFVYQYQKIADQLKADRKAGKLVNPDDNPQYALNEYNYLGSKIKAFLDREVNPWYSKLADQGVSWSDVGDIMFLDRIIGERKELANPRGFTPATAKPTRDKMLADMGEERAAATLEAVKNMRAAYKKVLEDAYTRGQLYGEELYKEMEKNDTYATFRVTKYMDDSVSAKIYKQFGTLEDVANTATATMAKMIATIRATERAVVTRKLIDYQLKEHGKEIELAETRWNGRTKAPVEAKDGRGLVINMEKGKPVGYYVDPFIAEMVNYGGLNETSVAIEALRQSQDVHYRPAFVGINLGFMAWNAPRDFLRFWKASPSMTGITVLKNYIKALPPAWRRVHGEYDAEINRLEQMGALNTTLNDMGKGMIKEDTQMDALWRKYTGDNGEVTGLRNQLLKVFSAVEGLGNLLETIPKVAADYTLRGTMPETDLANFIREKGGSPDFRKKGRLTHVTNPLFMFSNAAVQGNVSDYDSMTSPKTRTGYWLKTFLLNVLPKLLMKAALLGLFGEYLKHMYENISEYNKKNYNPIAWGLDENNKTVWTPGISDQMGQLIGVITWDMLNLMDNKTLEEGLMTLFADTTTRLVPGLNPLISTASTTLQYLQGQNPYDNFRNREIIPQTEFEAGGWARLKPFLKYQIQANGGSIIFGSSGLEQSPTSNTSTLERVLNLPVLSNVAQRFIRVSDYGQSELNQAAVNEVKRERANQRLEDRTKIDEAVTKVQSGANKIDVEKELAKSIRGDQKVTPEVNSRMTAARNAYRLALVKGKNDTNINSLIYATSNKEKAVILKRLSESMSQSDFEAFKKEAIQSEVVTPETIVLWKSL